MCVCVCVCLCIGGWGVVEGTVSPTHPTTHVNTQTSLYQTQSSHHPSEHPLGHSSHYGALQLHSPPSLSGHAGGNVVCFIPCLMCYSIRLAAEKMSAMVISAHDMRKGAWHDQLAWLRFTCIGSSTACRWDDKDETVEGQNNKAQRS